MSHNFRLERIAPALPTAGALALPLSPSQSLLWNLPLMAAAQALQKNDLVTGTGLRISRDAKSIEALTISRPTSTAIRKLLCC